MITITTNTIPPEIIQYFNSKLLCYPMPKGDCCERLWRIYQWIISHLRPKDLINAKRKKKIDDLIEEFLELYERTKAKEEEREREETHFTQGLFYHIEFINRSHKDLFDGLTKRTWSL